jgi:hypothetical protein
MVAKFDSLFLEAERPAWDALMSFLELGPYPVPDHGPLNVTASKRPFSRLGLALWERGLESRLRRLTPWPLRSAAKELFFTRSQGPRRLAETTDVLVPFPDLDQRWQEFPKWLEERGVGLR